MVMLKLTIIQKLKLVETLEWHVLLFKLFLVVKNTEQDQIRFVNDGFHLLLRHYRTDSLYASILVIDGVGGHISVGSALYRTKISSIVYTPFSLGVIGGGSLSVILYKIK